MFKYEGVSCPHCGKKFKPTDEILICPDCGAPYHRHCIEELGECMFQDLHQKGQSWQPPERPPHEEEETRYDSRVPLRCSRCGTANPADKLFCEVCGTPLNRDGANNSGGETQNSRPGGPEPDQGPFRQMAYNPYTTPFGGLSPDEEIEDIPVKDLAIYVGQTTHYFLPKFKEMAARGKKISWNWAAFFLDCFYLFYRKMWAPAIAVAVVSLLLSVPNMVLFYNTFALQLGLDVPSSESTLTLMYQLSNICYLLSLLLKFAVAAFSNRLYKDHVFRSVRKLREANRNASETDYSSALMAKGGVSVKAVVICIVVSLALSFVSSYFMISAMTSLY